MIPVAALRYGYGFAPASGAAASISLTPLNICCNNPLHFDTETEELSEKRARQRP
jgi:hypothetical protein